MSISIEKGQNLAQFISILSNPEFVNALKSVTKNTDSEKPDLLVKNLDKLKNILAAANSDSNVSKTSSGESLSLLKSNSISSTQTASSLDKLNSSDNAEINKLIANADLLEQSLNLDIIPPNDELVDLLVQFRKIIAKLDVDTRAVQKQSKDKEVKSELKLLVNSSTKSGLQESLTLVAK
ncbi:MAG: hypothetical protein H7263_08550 [Candidatus Sericytochromatia bacterium]|nr:hypothetical protein [Candidatus Sericytochromatia bacterium]